MQVCKKYARNKRTIKEKKIQQEKLGIINYQSRVRQCASVLINR